MLFYYGGNFKQLQVLLNLTRTLISQLRVIARDYSENNCLIYNYTIYNFNI